MISKAKLSSAFHYLSLQRVDRLKAIDCNAYACANIPVLFLTRLFVLCVHIYCTLTVTVQLCHKWIKQFLAWSFRQKSSTVNISRHPFIHPSMPHVDYRSLSRPLKVWLTQSNTKSLKRSNTDIMFSSLGWLAIVLGYNWRREFLLKLQ